MESAELKERALVTGALSGQQTAYRELFHRYYGRVMRTCTGILRGDRAEAQDAAQETFIRAFRNLGALERPERFAGWIFTIAENTCRTRQRRSGTRADLTRAYALLRVEGAEDANPLLRERKIALVRAEIEAIADDRHRELLRLYYQEGELTTREIAERVGIPHGTVCVTLMRLRARIQKKLAAAILRLEEPCPVPMPKTGSS
jgi:RNA polymerase sigma-70 factor (ECF subfamily)